jgi:XTP/dITP diphosphohydrolase
MSPIRHQKQRKTRMPDKRQGVLASGNAKKATELSALLEVWGLGVCLQTELGVSEVDEPYFTFVENALTKARHASRATGRWAIADDSGLCVDALGGAPGVFSARFAGEPKSDARNNALLLERLSGPEWRTPEQRRAHFICVLVMVRHADDPEPLIAEGRWHGHILHAPQGEGGFGYDPLFGLLNSPLSAAQLPAEQKNTASHRAKAMNHLMSQLHERTGF